MAVKRERISRKEAQEAPTTAVPAVGGRLRPRYARLGAFGLLLAGLGPAIMLVAILVTVGPSDDEVGFAATTAVIGLVGAALSWRFGTWSKIVGIVATLAIGMALFWTVFLLAAVNSPLEFTIGLLVPTGIVLSLFGHIAALVSKRRGNLTERATGVERRVVQVVSAAILAGVLVSVALFLNARQTVDPALASGAEVVRMSNFEFEPATLEIGAGTSTKILVRNDDIVAHTFTVPALGIDESLVPGSEVLVETTAEAGTFVVYCKPHSDTSEPDPDPADNMVMRLVAR